MGNDKKKGEKRKEENGKNTNGGGTGCLGLMSWQRKRDQRAHHLLWLQLATIVVERLRHGPDRQHALPGMIHMKMRIGLHILDVAESDLSQSNRGRKKKKNN